MKKLEMKKVVSSNVESIGFDDEQNLLYVKFIGGAMYQYGSATKQMYEGLLTSPSVGRTLRPLVSALPTKKLSDDEVVILLGGESGGTEEKKEVTIKTEVQKTKNVLKVLLAYYQGNGDILKDRVKTITGTDVIPGERVWSVILKEGGVKRLYPIRVGEIELVDSKHYISEIVMDVEGIGIPVLVLRNSNKGGSDGK